MAETKFSAEQLEQFIDMYRSFECLWDVRCKDYRDITKRNNAYEAIADIMNINVEQVKKKINNIRSTYLQEKKKVDLSKTTGSSTDAIYTPSLSWFSLLRFLDDVTTPRKTTSTPTVGRNEKKNANKENTTTVTQESSCSTSLPMQRNKRYRAQETLTDKGFENAVNTLSAICKEESTEFDKFGECVAAQLKQFPLEEAVETQLEIQQLLTRKRLRFLNERKRLNRASRTPDLAPPFSPEDYNASTPTSFHSYHSITTSADTLTEFGHCTTDNSSTYPDPQINNQSSSAYTNSQTNNNPLSEAMKSANIVGYY